VHGVRGGGGGGGDGGAREQRGVEQEMQHPVHQWSRARGLAGGERNPPTHSPTHSPTTEHFK